MIDLWAKRIQRLSLWNPSRACITDTVTTSASVIRGVIPTVGRHRLSCGDAFNSSSILQYSAVARVSKSTYTWPPWARCLGNVDHGRPRSCSLSVPLGIDHLGPRWENERTTKLRWREVCERTPRPTGASLPTGQRHADHDRCHGTGSTLQLFDLETAVVVRDNVHLERQENLLLPAGLRLVSAGRSSRRGMHLPRQGVVPPGGLTDRPPKQHAKKASGDLVWSIG